MKRKTIVFFLSLFILLLFVNLYPLPYYISGPGMAKELDKVIEVENGYHEEGEFMLTTVSMAKATISTYFFSKFKNYTELEPIKSVHFEDETDEEYRVRQLYLMESSQENALQVAFRKAGKKVEVNYNGIYVLSVMEGFPGDGKLKAGDRITTIDHQSFESTKDFTDYVQSKNPGDQITVSFVRDGSEMSADIIVDMIPTIKKPGIGISLVDDKEVWTDPPAFINTEEIGGPSAGLMFSLEIYNQLSKKDITKGYKIAGTGTISENGDVGPIGGIEKKIVAADKAGADIFFAPNEKGKEGSNYEKARATAKDIGSNMKIIPVDTFDEALDYLNDLEHKNR